MLEKSTYNKTILDAKASGITLYRLRDGNGRTPTDFIGHTHDGTFVYLETKIDRRVNFPSINWSLFEPHQTAALKKGTTRSCISIVCIWHNRVYHYITMRTIDDYAEGKPLEELHCIKGKIHAIKPNGVS